MKKKTIRKFLFLAFLLVFLFSSGMLIFQSIQYKEGDEDYEEAVQLVQIPDLEDLPLPALPEAAEPEQAEETDPYTEALSNMDFATLQEINSDVFGWILVPGTRISYPLLQGPNNTYYLNHTWQNAKNSVGAIFLECMNKQDLSDFNTIVYGHRMNNQSMFGLLHDFQKADYWKTHPYVYLTTESGAYRYTIFSAYEAKVTGDTYLLGFPDRRSRQDYIDYCLSQSAIDTGIAPRVWDRILTLSTCTGHGHATRWVVQAVLWGEESDLPPDQPKPEPEPEPAPEAASSNFQTPDPGSSSAPASSSGADPSAPPETPSQDVTPDPSGTPQEPSPDPSEPPPEQPSAPSASPEEQPSAPSEPAQEPVLDPAEPETAPAPEADPPDGGAYGSDPAEEPGGGTLGPAAPAPESETNPSADVPASAPESAAGEGNPADVQTAEDGAGQ